MSAVVISVGLCSPASALVLRPGLGGRNLAWLALHSRALWEGGGGS